MKDEAVTENEGTIVIFGEVLFDVFPSGEAILGGAPFNVAWNLQGLGFRPLVISRVGDDKRGHQVLQNMRDWGMETKGLQVDQSHPTGTVQVTIQDGQPQFSILPDQAYDYIEADHALASIGESPVFLLYHGTLVARSPVSKSTLQTLRNEKAGQRLVDINLRAPWWKPQMVRDALAGATWAKLNDAELAAVVSSDSIPAAEHSSVASRLCLELGLRFLVVTRGAAGALLVTQNGATSDSRPEKLEDVVDSVGAGDALSAVLVVGLCLGWPDTLTLSRAVEFASSICRIRGATSTDGNLYSFWLNKWKR